MNDHLTLNHFLSLFAFTSGRSGVLALDQAARVPLAGEISRRASQSKCSESRESPFSHINHSHFECFLPFIALCCSSVVSPTFSRNMTTFSELQHILRSIYIGLLNAIHLGTLFVADHVLEFLKQHDQESTWAIISAAIMPVVLDLVNGIPTSFTDLSYVAPSALFPTFLPLTV